MAQCLGNFRFPPVLDILPKVRIRPIAKIRVREHTLTMIGPLLSVAAAALAQLPQPQFSSSHGWGVVTKANMSEPGPTVQNEIGKAASSEAKLIWAQLFLTTDEGITFNVAIRGCAPGMTDFRQTSQCRAKAGWPLRSRLSGRRRKPCSTFLKKDAVFPQARGRTSWAGLRLLMNKYFRASVQTERPLL